MKRHPSRLDRFLRFSRLQEDKANIAWREASHETGRARVAHEQALAVQEEIAVWKVAAAHSGGLNIDHYEMALALEAEAAIQTDAREQALTASERLLQEARDRLQEAAAAVKAVERRDDRQQRQAQETAEKKQFEDLRDAWLGRSEKNRG